MKVGFTPEGMEHLTTTVKFNTPTVEGKIQSVNLEELPESTGFKSVQVGISLEGEVYLILTRPRGRCEVIRVSSDELWLIGSTKGTIRFDGR